MPSIKLIKLFSALPAFLALSGCGATPLTAKLEREGIVNCQTQQAQPDSKASCEISAVARIDGELVFANDKPIPGEGRSALFAVPYAGFGDNKQDAFQLNGAKTRYFTARPLVEARKFESLTTTPDKQWILAATAFDRYNPEKTEQAAYNMLMAWPMDSNKLPTGPDHEAVQILHLGSSSDTNSASLRSAISKALDGSPYFKIEGLAAVPAAATLVNSSAKGRLLFGVREEGKDYKNPRFVIKIIQASYILENGKFQLLEDFTLLADYSEKINKALPEGFGHKLGLSDLSYEPNSQTLYILTSFEDDAGDNPQPASIGAYLWGLSLAELEKAQAPKPILAADCDPTGKPVGGCLFEFKQHKAEGMALLGNNRLFIVFDDDRIKTTLHEQGQPPRERKSENESGYQIILLH